MHFVVENSRFLKILNSHSPFIFSIRMWFMVKVTFGEHDTCNNKPSASRYVSRSISRQSIFNVIDNDIALLRLTESVPLNQFIRPICLPDNKGIAIGITVNCGHSSICGFSEVSMFFTLQLTSNCLSTRLPLKYWNLFKPQGLRAFNNRSKWNDTEDSPSISFQLPHTVDWKQLLLVGVPQPKRANPHVCSIKWKCRFCPMNNVSKKRTMRVFRLWWAKICCVLDFQKVDRIPVRETAVDRYSCNGKINVMRLLALCHGVRNLCHWIEWFDGQDWDVHHHFLF